jgi:hypothetical protein
MTWTETHRRWAALRDVQAEINRRHDGELPWSDALAEIFGTRHQLALALQYAWTLTLTARVDNAVELDGAGAARLAAQRHAGRTAAVRRVLERHFATLPGVEHDIVASFGGHTFVPTPA